MARTQKDPLAPLETAVSCIVFLTGLGLVVFLGLTLVGHRGTINGVGKHEVCLTTGPGQGVGYGGEGINDHPIGLRPHVRSNASQIDICNEAPSGLDVALGFSKAFLSEVGLLAGMLLLWRVIGQARAQGVFGDTIPRGLRQVALFLAAWGIGGWVWRGFVDNVLLRHMAHDVSFLWPPRFPFATLLLAVGLVTLARIMSLAVALREDSEATI